MNTKSSSANNKGAGGIDTDEEEKSYFKSQMDHRNFRSSLFNPNLESYGKGGTRSRTSSDPSSTE